MEGINYDKNDSISIYFVISCKGSQNNISYYSCYLEEKMIHLSPGAKIRILESNLILIKQNDNFYINLENRNSLNGKDIYLYTAKIIAGNLNEFNIKLKDYLEESFVSKNPFPINEKNKIIFIYNIPFKLDGFLNRNVKTYFKDEIINEFLENKFRINNVQKFLIFKEYLNKHENSNFIDDLLENTANEINKTKEIIDFEFMLEFILTLIDNEKNFTKISNKKKQFFELVFSNFKDIDKIIIVNYKNKKYHEVIAIINNYKKNIKNKTNIILNIDLFTLLYYQINDNNKFSKIFNNISKKSEATKFIIKHIKYFQKFNCSQLQLIYNYAEDKQINIILSLSLNFNEYIKFFCLNLDKILSKNLYRHINLKDCPVPGEEYDFNYLKQFIDAIIDNDKIYFPKEQILELINKLKFNDYKKLIQLKSIFINSNSHKEILNRLDEVIHFTGKIFIEENKLDNYEIISFIQEDAKIYYKDYEKNYQFARLISHINLDKIDNKFIEKFIGKNYDYKKLMKNNYRTFINSIVERAKSFKHLKVLYSIFNIKNLPNPEIISEIINLLSFNKLVKDKNISNLEFSKILGILFEIVDGIDLDRLIRGIKKKFSENDFNEILTNILNDYWNKLSKNTRDKLINTIYNNNEIMPNRATILILNNFNNIDAKKYFLEKQKKIIKEEEIYNIKISDNLRFILDLIKNGYFNGTFNSVTYIKNTREFMNEQIEILKDFNFNMERLHILYKLNERKEEGLINLKILLFIIALGDQTIADELYLTLINKVNTCYEIFKKLKIIINIFDSYYSHNEKDTLIEYNQIMKEMKENLISKFPDESNISNFKTNFKKAFEIYQLKDSKIFVQMFEYNSQMAEDKNNDSLIVNKTCISFKKLAYLFQEQNEKNMNSKELEEIENVLQKINEEEIDNEVNKIIKILNINHLKKEEEKI